ncbi:hypothetical protein [Nakamurella sp.]|uniref:hypothetical protein n=1 Tax=Nakamurella sp. TaxID=1869182 RepID=UPI003B3B9AB5
MNATSAIWSPRSISRRARTSSSEAVAARGGGQHRRCQRCEFHPGPEGCREQAQVIRVGRGQRPRPLDRPTDQGSFGTLPMTAGSTVLPIVAIVSGRFNRVVVAGVTTLLAGRCRRVVGRTGGQIGEVESSRVVANHLRGRLDQDIGHAVDQSQTLYRIIASFATLVPRLHQSAIELCTYTSLRQR